MGEMRGWRKFFWLWRWRRIRFWFAFVTFLL